MTALTFSLLTLAGCAGSARVEYLPGSDKITLLRKGESAPEDGFLVPPSKMAELGETR